MLEKTQETYKKERKAEKESERATENYHEVAKKHSKQTAKGFQKIKEAFLEMEKAADKYIEFLTDEKQKLF